MKKYYVYEIVNLMGSVEYVGETCNPKGRLANHKSKSRTPGSGRFGNRSDIFMNIVKEFDNKTDAFNYQCDLQKEYGLKPDTERNYCNLKIPIVAYDKNGKFIGEYDSTTIAANSLNIKQPAISYVINGKRKHAKGYTFQYKVVK
jgi:predicted GIY-YIG superfamily endonuclease